MQLQTLRHSNLVRRVEPHELWTEPISPELILVQPELRTWAVRIEPRTDRRHEQNARTGDAPTAARRVAEPVGRLDSITFPRVPLWCRGRVRATARVSVTAVTCVVLGWFVAAFDSDVPRGPQPGFARWTADADARERPRAHANRRADAPMIVRWQAIPRASFYTVQIFRGDSKVYEASSSTPRLAVPAKWHYRGRPKALEPGMYHWYVWPAYGSGPSARYGRLAAAGTRTVKSR